MVATVTATVRFHFAIDAAGVLAVLIDASLDPCLTVIVEEQPRVRLATVFPTPFHAYAVGIAGSVLASGVVTDHWYSLLNVHTLAQPHYTTL